MATGNHFIDNLTPRDQAVLKPHLHKVALRRDDVLIKAGDPVSRVVLPVDCIVSVILELEDGRQVETRTLGRESGFGLLHALGAAVSYETILIQVSGDAYVIDRRDLAARARESPALTNSIVRHAQATLVQSAQSVACNALHDVRQRLCRWLLMTQDRLQSDILPLKQEHLAIMLAVQRTTVATAASALQKEGAIRSGRGRITVLDRHALKAGSCECYSAVEQLVARMVGEELEQHKAAG
jgi:CRP-like cAMP-binding protein